MTIPIILITVAALIAAGILTFRRVVIRFGETLASGIFREAGRRWGGKKS